MDSTTLPRTRRVRPEEDLAFRPPPPRGEGVARSAGGEVPALRLPRALPILIAPLLMPLASATARHWLVEIGATLCVAGGFIAAPFLTLVAWIGLALPRAMPLHQASTALFLVAILWMAAALVGAHLHHHRRQAQATPPSGDSE